MKARPVWVLLSLVAGCDGGDAVVPDPTSVTISGRVLIGGAPAPSGDAVVFLWAGSPALSLFSFTDSDGRYSISAPLGTDACDRGFLAFSDQSPFPLESVVTPLPVVPSACQGGIQGPDFQLPELPLELLPVNVFGTVTLRGTPLAVPLTLVVQSNAWGPTVLTTASSESDGTYRIESAVPLHYCGSMHILTVPPSDRLQSVPACFDQALDIEISP